MDSSDPFDAVRDEVKDTMTKIKALYERYQEILHSHTPNSPPYVFEEMEWTRNEIEQKLKTAASDLEDLEETVQIVESNPSKYSQFEEAELKDRRKFVDDTKAFLKRVGNTLAQSTNRSERKKQLLSNAAGSMSTPSNQGDSKKKSDSIDTNFDRSREEETQNFIDDQLASQQLLMRQQDDRLGLVEDQTDRLKEVAADMSNAMDDQMKDLDKLETEVGEAKGLIGKLNQKITKMLKDKGDRYRLLIIFLLLLVIFGLIIGMVVIDFVIPIVTNFLGISF